MDMLKKFDKDNIPDNRIAKVDPYIVNESFTPDMVKKASVACEAICMWVRAMHKYYHVARAVEPKRQALAAAQSELEETMAVLNDAKARLQEVLDKLTKLENQYNEAVAEKDNLEKSVVQCQERLEAAVKLMDGLGGEETRWKAGVNSYVLILTILWTMVLSRQAP